MPDTDNLLSDSSHLLVFFAAMADSQERIDHLFLENNESAVPFPLGSMETTPHRRRNDNADNECNDESLNRELPEMHSPPSRTLSSTSTVSRSSRISNTSSQRSSASTALSSAPSVGPIPPPPVFNYNFPCEFGTLGCQVSFDPPEKEHWISHAITHFNTFSPPRKAVCIFCDDIFRIQTDARSMWRERLMHIASHYENLEQHGTSRPDYFLLDYLKDTKLLSIEDYKYAIQFSERPQVDGLVKYGHKTTEMKMKEERSGHEPHDLEKEKRQIRKERKKGKGKGAHT